MIPPLMKLLISTLLLILTSISFLRVFFGVVPDLWATTSLTSKSIMVFVGLSTGLLILIWWISIMSFWKRVIESIHENWQDDLREGR